MIAMPLPAHTPADEALSYYSPEDMLEQAVFLARWREAHARVDAGMKEMVAEINAAYRARKEREAAMPVRQPRATDADYLDGDYEMVGSIQSSEWGL